MVWPQNYHRPSQARSRQTIVVVRSDGSRIIVSRVWYDHRHKPVVSCPGNGGYRSWSEWMQEAVVYLGPERAFSVGVEGACLCGWACFHASPPEARPMGMAASFVSKSSTVCGIVPSWGSSPLSRSTCLASSQ